MKFQLSSSASSIALAAALAVAPAVFGGQAQATPSPINGSDTFLGGSATLSGGSGDLLSATSITLGSQFWSVAGNGATGNFTSLAIAGTTPFNYGSTISSSSLVLNNLGSFTFTSNDGSFAAAPSLFVSPNTLTSTVVASSGSIAGGSESLSIYVVGTFTPAGSLSAYAPDDASETISFTETGITTGASPSFGSFSVSASFASPASAPPPPPPTNAPEPASLGMLGAGLIGLGAARRRRG